ncbi:MAG: response regulator [Bacteroidales bacterium]|nr:response regulator [Bacteroidales bacterium]
MIWAINILNIENLASTVFILLQNNTGMVSGSVFYYFIPVIIALIAGLGYFLYVNQKLKKQYAEKLKEKDAKIDEQQSRLSQFNQKLEEEIKERTTQLRKELDERKKVDVSLKKALKQAEDANYLKNAFLSNMSHEIRTPLNGIIGFSSLLEQELSMIENEELFEYAKGISQSGERLLHLLNNVIDISRIEANDLEIDLRSCDVNDVAEKTGDLYSFTANEKGLKFNFTPGEIPQAMADESNLSRILSDIIDNSVKYTERGFINISTGFDKTQNEIFIRVKDTGIGIDSAFLPDIFEAFRQESLGYSRKYQGAGLGLPLAKRLTELMNGRIDVDSVKGIGTTVTVYLPSAKEKAEEEKKPAEAPEKASKEESKKKSTPYEQVVVFVVEDDRMNRLVLQKMLDSKYKIIMAVDGEETIKKVKDYYDHGQLFDIMLFDINLPAPWDGIKLMKEIKQKWPEYKQVPFVAQTAYAMSGDKERFLEAGFDDYLPKPVVQGKLFNIIDVQLQKFREVYNES